MLRWDGHPLEAVLLDLDDTLLDNRSGVLEAQRAVAAWLAERLGDADPEALSGALGAASHAFWGDRARLAAGRLDLVAARRTIVAGALGRTGRAADAALVADAARLYTELREASYALFAGVESALARLRARVPALGLVTNGAADAQRRKIERFGLARWFDVIAVEGELGFGKPDVRAYGFALAELGVAPQAALMAGDDYENDVLGALGAGLHAVWIEPEGAGPPAAAGAPPRPHRTLDSFVALTGALLEAR